MTKRGRWGVVGLWLGLLVLGVVVGIAIRQKRGLPNTGAEDLGTKFQPAWESAGAAGIELSSSEVTTGRIEAVGQDGIARISTDQGQALNVDLNRVKVRLRVEYLNSLGEVVSWSNREMALAEIQNFAKAGVKVTLSANNPNQPEEISQVVIHSVYE